MERQRPSGKKTGFWTKFRWGFAIIVLSSMLAIWITGYSYIYKTLIYTYPDIDDIGLFDDRPIMDTVGVQWPNATSYNKDSLPIETRAKLEETESVAFLIIKNDSVVHEEYWDHYSENQLSNSFSMAKSIVSILVGIASEEGYFSLDDSVGKYLPEFRKGMNAKLKIRHLLYMSSGLDWDEAYNSLFSKTTEAYYGSDLKGQVLKLKVVREPGTKFEYMSCNTVLLSLIINKTTGKTISDFASEKLWKPIMATDQAYWSLDHNGGLEKSYCCFYSCARDFARIGKLYMDSGAWNGHQLVSKDFVKFSLTPNAIPDETKNPVDYYGAHWWLMNHNGHEIFYARGILGQYIISIPDERMIIVRLGKKRGNKTADNHYDDMLQYVDGALKLYSTKLDSLQ
ncbi:MAG: serine hydrolase [Bacteroidetes bacterium]|nr:serine hydrolase [Bacteroidota bacterium]